MRRATVRILAALLSLSLPGIASAGTISGTIMNPDQCTGVQVLSRAGRHPLRPKVIVASYDPKTGEFRTPDLPEGRYDLRLLITDGVLEGLDLRVEPPEEGEAKPLTAADNRAIAEFITQPVTAYMDVNRPVTVRGHATRARVLVEVIRYRKAHGRPQGEITWGMEVWCLECWTGAWVRPPASRGRKRVLRRLRVPADMPAQEFERMVCLFDPDIGGIEVGPGKSVEGLSVTVPEPDPALGKVAGSVMKQLEEDRTKNPDRFD